MRKNIAQGGQKLVRSSGTTCMRVLSVAPKNTLSWLAKEMLEQAKVQGLNPKGVQNKYTMRIELT